MAIRTENLTDPAGVSVVTLDRPERRNALDAEALADLRSTIGRVSAGDVRVLVLTGAGTNFCAGADLSTVEDEHFVAELRGLLHDLTTLPLPVLAAIHGPALGAGTQLAMACDLRIATSDATFGIPAAKLGLTVDQYTVHHLAESVGHSVARAMLTAAEVFDAARLERVGFVHRLVEPGSDVLVEAVAWAGRLARLAPLTIAAHKVMLAEVEVAPEPTGGSLAARAAAWDSEDLAAGLAAFAEKRRPEFRGR